MAVKTSKVPKPSDPQLVKRSQNSAREAWRMFEIISEFVGATETLQTIQPAVSIFGSARMTPEHPYYKVTEDIAKRLSDAGFSVISGGGPGIMEAANRGAHEAGGKSVGLSIELPHEQFANAYISPELSFNFKYFFMRKLWFAQIAKALIVFPGGFGTMDELWEMLTLLQTGKLPKQNIILIYGRKYWDEVLNWKAMVRWGTIDENEYKMLQFADTVDEAFDHIRAGLEKYHMDADPFLQAY
jgi:uncharacterized protein (TIGR00730 family)